MTEWRNTHQFFLKIKNVERWAKNNCQKNKENFKLRQNSNSIKFKKICGTSRSRDFHASVTIYA